MVGNEIAVDHGIDVAGGLGQLMDAAMQAGWRPEAFADEMFNVEQFLEVLIGAEVIESSVDHTVRKQDDRIPLT